MKPSPVEHLERLSARYPGAWGVYDRALRDRAELGDWPSWCHCPLAAAYAVVSGGGIIDPALLPDVGRVGAVAAWRPTQSIYRFDETLLGELWETPLSGDLPTDHLQRLPEWCVYVEVGRDGIDGFFAHLESDANSKREELRLAVDAGGELVPLALHLGGTLDDAVRGFISEAAAQEVAMRGQSFIEPGIEQRISRFVAPLVSVLLYLCASDAELRPTRGRGRVKPKMRASKRGATMPAAKKLEVWETGFSLGAMLREGTSEGSGESVRPHVRRAHWHSYWMGSGSDKRRELRWLSPILVKGYAEKPTIRTVKGSD